MRCSTAPTCAPALVSDIAAMMNDAPLAAEAMPSVQTLGWMKGSSVPTRLIVTAPISGRSMPKRSISRPIHSPNSIGIIEYSATSTPTAALESVIFTAAIVTATRLPIITPKVSIDSPISTKSRMVMRRASSAGRPFNDNKCPKVEVTMVQMKWIEFSTMDE